MLSGGDKHTPKTSSSDNTVDGSEKSAPAKVGSEYPITSWWFQPISKILVK